MSFYHFRFYDEQGRKLPEGGMSICEVEYPGYISWGVKMFKEDETFSEIIGEQDSHKLSISDNLDDNFTTPGMDDAECMEFALRLQDKMLYATDDFGNLCQLEYPTKELLENILCGILP